MCIDNSQEYEIERQRLKPRAWGGDKALYYLSRLKHCIFWEVTLLKLVHGTKPGITDTVRRDVSGRRFGEEGVVQDCMRMLRCPGASVIPRSSTWGLGRSSLNMLILAPEAQVAIIKPVEHWITIRNRNQTGQGCNCKRPWCLSTEIRILIRSVLSG